MKKLASLLLFLSCAAFALAASKYPDISEKDLQAAIASKSVVLLDANGSDSYREAHIPGAIDFIAQEKQIGNLLPANKDALIVAYCGNEQCTAYKAAAKTAEKLGYTNIKHFAPGIQGWVKSGAPTEKAM
ncbi:MAG TPA: rhodanese-like domain-containing protein [Opitutaceae bacterium]|nr:rhodanese-like domain-containing protein [Opitutaceae bacterium]